MMTVNVSVFYRIRYVLILYSYIKYLVSMNCVQPTQRREGYTYVQTDKVKVQM